MSAPHPCGVIQFEVGVAYMPVPRCDRCTYWHPVTTAYGRCVRSCYPAREPEPLLAEMTTHGSFGCVEHQAKP